MFGRKKATAAPASQAARSNGPGPEGSGPKGSGPKGSGHAGIMRAMALTGFGGPEMFQEIEVPRPEPGPGEVLIKVAASSVNPVDYKIRDGRAAVLAPDFPAILHPDCAGTIAAAGPGVSDFREGDAVYAFASGLAGRPGALAEYMVARAGMVAPISRKLSLAQAAALPLVAVTAWFALADRIETGPEHRVLIIGGTGGVGHVAVQLAKARGAHVTALCGGTEKCAQAMALGADAVIDYNTTKATAYAGLAPDGQGFDVIFNTPGAETINDAVMAAAQGGTILDILGDFPTKPGFQIKWLTFKSLFAGSPILMPEGYEIVGRILRTVTALVDEGALMPLIDPKVFSFREVGAAHSHAEFGSPMGKVSLVQDLTAEG